MKFTKMQGLGNDYIYINCFEEVVEDPGKLSIEMSNRNFGVGADGLVLIMDSKAADFKMRIFNADGSEAEMCGNAARCIAKYVYERNLISKEEISLETLSGIKRLNLIINNNLVKKVTVDMGEPILKPEEIPVCSKSNKLNINILDKNFDLVCVSMGNPHSIIYTDNIEKIDIKKYGSVLECSKFFPKKSNIEFVEIINENTIKMRVWERGSGETLSCGTGACASVVAGVIDKNLSRKVKVKLLGGELEIDWNEKDNHVYMNGCAEFSFDGVWLK